MKYTVKINSTINSDWDKNLQKSKYSSFFQASDYLSLDSKNFFPLFISVLDENGITVGQLGLTIIKSAVLYTDSSFRFLFRLIEKITTRGIWLYGPIIHTDNKSEQKKILQIIIQANNEICKKYDLVFIEGYTNPYVRIDDDTKKQFRNNDYILSEYVTFIADLTKSSEEIWNSISKKTRGDVNRAKRRNIIIKELQTFNELQEYVILHSTWAKTKGLELEDQYENIKKMWNNHKMKNEKFFLAYLDDNLISALRLTCFNGIVYTHFVLSSYSESTNLGGTLLTWHALEWAKNSGMKIYDFSGGPKSSTKNNNDSLVFYKKKWGGDEYIHYNLIKKSKKINYFFYNFLFKLLRTYHDFKGKKFNS